MPMIDSLAASWQLQQKTYDIIGTSWKLSQAHREKIAWFYIIFFAKNFTWFLTKEDKHESLLVPIYSLYPLAGFIIHSLLSSQ
jgi:hypothetical protein